MYTIAIVIQAFNHSVAHMYNTVTYLHGAIPLVFFSPCWFPLCPPFVSPSTYLAPSSCDRNRPPQSQVACKLTPFAPPFTPPLPNPNPNCSAPTTTTSGIFRSCYTEHLQRGKMISVVGNNVKHFFVLLPTLWKKFSALWATTHKNCHAEQWNIPYSCLYVLYRNEILLCSILTGDFLKAI